jgi:hypothetical protein
MKLEDRLTDSFRRRADAVEPDNRAWAEIERRAHAAPPSHSRRAAVAAAALLLSAASIGFVLRAFPSDTVPGEEPTYEVTELSLTRGLGDVLVAEGSVWVVKAGAVDRIDPATGEVTHVSVGGVDPDHAALAAGGDRIWVLTTEGVAGIDPATNDVVARFVIQSGVEALAFADGRLLLGGSAEGNGLILAVDPRHGDILGTTPTDGHGISSILPTEQGVWVGHSSAGGSGLVQLSPDLIPEREFPAVETVRSLAIAGGRVWGVGVDTLYAIDPSTGAVEVMPFPRAAAVASAADGLWLLLATGSTSPDVYLPDPGQPAALLRIDPDTGDQLGEPIELDRFTPAKFTATPEGAWVSFYDGGVLARVAPEGAQPISARYRLSYVPRTASEGDRVLLPIVFPDGTSAELTYPPELALAELGAQVFGPSAPRGCAGQAFYGDPRGVVYEGDALQTWTGPRGETVGLYRGTWDGPGRFDSLVRFVGPWAIVTAVPADASVEDLRRCAEGLDVALTDGWPVIKPPGGYATRRSWGPPVGPEGEFGNLAVGRRLVILWPGPCESSGNRTIEGRRITLDEDFASWCDPGGMMRIHVYFEPGSDFFERVFEGLVVRDVRLAS